MTSSAKSPTFLPPHLVAGGGILLQTFLSEELGLARGSFIPLHFFLTFLKFWGDSLR